MNSDLKFGLRNASNILNKIKLKYLRTDTQQAPAQPQNKTFVEEDSLELQENPRTVSHGKPTTQAKGSQRRNQMVEQFSEIKSVEKEVPSFCDRLILDNLHKTLSTYQEDLDTLTANRAFLQEQIQFMAQKIRKLRELQNSNKMLTQQNQKAKENLKQLIEQYHQSQHNLLKSRLAQQECFNFLRSKVRMVLRQTGEDYNYIGFVDLWNRHVEQMLTDSKTIDRALHKGVVVDEQKEQIAKVERIAVPAKDINEFEGEEYLAPDEPKSKKKLTAAEKNALLGDLKSFAKNFKLPPS